MCTQVTRRDERDLGELHVLCDEYPGHLLDILALDGEPGPAHALLSSLGASVAFIEPDYFDVDFRSEFTATQETTFAAYSPDAERVHFFAGRPPARSARIYDYLRMVEANQRKRRSGARHAPSENRRRYLGYAVLRSSSPTVGRALLSPETLGPRVTAGRPEDYIRTMVTEQVTVLGVQLQAVGVPFMQQDGTLLRCGSVSAWMAHYTSVLRGYVPRRPSAAFSAVHGAQQLAYGRPYPDNFVTAMSQTQILQARDLPPEVLHPEKLTTGRALRWTDRNDLDAHLQTVNKAKKPSERDSGREIAWFVENLTASVCRYLNSGFPCIINVDDHSVLACGYIRSQHLDGGHKPTIDRSEGSDPRAVAAFVVQDDQMGPYQILGVPELMEKFTSGKAFSVVVPLPRGLWLDGNSAETAGLRAIQELLADRIATGVPASPSFQAMREALFNASSGSGPSGRFGVRSFVSVSSDFKRDFGLRSNDAVAARLAGYTLMPKFVWAVEIYDRDLQKEKNPATIATIALDGSSVSMDGVIRPPAPVFVHLPGEVGIVRLGGDGIQGWAWEPISARSYVSGRWSVRNSTFANATDLAARLKTSMASSSM